MVAASRSVPARAIATVGRVPFASKAGVRSAARAPTALLDSTAKSDVASGAFAAVRTATVSQATAASTVVASLASMIGIAPKGCGAAAVSVSRSRPRPEDFREASSIFRLQERAGRGASSRVSRAGLRARRDRRRWSS